MDLGRALAADLRDLAVDLSAGGYTRTTLAMLDRNVRRTVPSSLGLTITLSDEKNPGLPVEVNLVPRTVAPHEVGAVLRVPLARLVPTVGGAVTFYAAEQGAFEPLVHDLATVLHLRPGDLDQPAAPPAAPISPGIRGLQDFSLVNRALGVLLNRGYTLPDARMELQQRAESARTDVVSVAQALLTR